MHIKISFTSKMFYLLYPRVDFYLFWHHALQWLLLFLQYLRVLSLHPPFSVFSDPLIFPKNFWLKNWKIVETKSKTRYFYPLTGNKIQENTFQVLSFPTFSNSDFDFQQWQNSYWQMSNDVGDKTAESDINIRKLSPTSTNQAIPFLTKKHSAPENTPK